MPDINKLMQQAAEMQAEVQRRQAELAAATFDGSAGGGMVTATIKGTGELVSVTIDPAVLDPEDPEMVGDLVVAAVNAAHGAMAEEAGASLGIDPESLPDLGDLGGLGDLLG
jgi:DNA-binding YbaB/EbfC family protein